MSNRIRKGWQFTKQSLAVLKSHKKLLLFPLISGIATLIILASAFIPLWYFDFNLLLTHQYHAYKDTTIIISFLAGLFIFNLITIFFNAAMIASVAHYFKTNEVNLKLGLKKARACLPHILGWTIFSTTVGFFIRLFQSNSGRIGAIASLLMGLSWTIISYFIIPILVFEKTGPIKSLKRSANLAKETWGPSLTSNLGLALIINLVRLMTFIPLVIGIYFGDSLDKIMGLLVTLFLMIVVNIVSTALGNILHSTLYLYATEKNIFGPFNEQFVTQAFRTRLK